MSVIINKKTIAPLYIGDREIVRRYIKGEIVYQKKIDHRFRFKNVSDSLNKLTLVSKGSIVTLERSSDGINYEPCDIYKGIDLQPGEVVYLRGINDTIGDMNGYNYFTSTNNITCHGNIMNLIDGGLNTDVIKNTRQFYRLFQNMTTLITSPELPATKLANDCYGQMFQGCTSLTQAPELPATELAESCYGGMFGGCTSLTTAPELPATKLAKLCYGGMFYECTSLTTAPELYSTTLAESCYEDMFNGCTSLTQAPELPATELADSCYVSMFSRCSILTQAPELPATKLTYRCYSAMFYGCISLKQAPELLATELVERCYNQMFQNCSNLRLVRVKAAPWIPNCSSYWLENVAKSGILVKSKDLQIGNFDGQLIKDHPSGIPLGWTATDGM